jgi:hypothetical protein
MRTPPRHRSAAHALVIPGAGGLGQAAPPCNQSCLAVNKGGLRAGGRPSCRPRPGACLAWGPGRATTQSMYVRACVQAMHASKLSPSHGSSQRRRKGACCLMPKVIPCCNQKRVGKSTALERVGKRQLSSVGGTTTLECAAMRTNAALPRHRGRAARPLVPPWRPSTAATRGAARARQGWRGCCVSLMSSGDRRSSSAGCAGTRSMHAEALRTLQGRGSHPLAAQCAPQGGPHKMKAPSAPAVSAAADPTQQGPAPAACPFCPSPAMHAGCVIHGHGRGCSLVQAGTQHNPAGQTIPSVASQAGPLNPWSRNTSTRAGACAAIRAQAQQSLVKRTRQRMRCARTATYMAACVGAPWQRPGAWQAGRMANDKNGHQTPAGRLGACERPPAFDHRPLDALQLG